MADPFDSSSIDGTTGSAVPLTIVDQLFLKPFPPVIAMRLESPVSESSGERIVQQWALTRDRAQFIINTLQEYLDAPT